MNILLIEKIIQLALDLVNKIKEHYGSDVDVTAEMIDEARALIPPKLELIITTTEEVE